MEALAIQKFFALASTSFHLICGGKVSQILHCYSHYVSKRGAILFAALSIIWGTPYLFIKYALEDFDPVFIVFARCAPTALILLLLVWKQGKLKENWHFWKYCTLFAVIEMVFPWYFVTAAEKSVSSGLAGLMLAVVPIFAVITSRIRGEDNAFNVRRIAGIAIGIAGVFALVGVDSLNSDINIGAILMLIGAALGYATAPVLISTKLKSADSTSVIAMSSLAVTLIYLPLVPSHLPTHQPGASAILAIITLAVVSTILGFAVFFALIAEIGPMKATLITYINPAVAILLGVIFLGEELTLGLLIGFPLVLGGSWLASKH
jgi:drug/metabolite transporter (DMT)-like permease